eukprot:214871_1
MAPYFHIGHHLTNSSIGSIIAIQFFITSILSGWGGNFADSMERLYPLRGRVCVLIFGITLGTSTFLLESTDYIVKFYELTLSSLIESDSELVGGDVVKDEKEEGNRAYPILFMWHLWWRIIYAVAVALTSPVLDGLTLAHLKRDAAMAGTSHEHEGNKYGRERLHGAIWWGIGNVIIGCSIDRWGLDILTTLSIISTVACYIAIATYYICQVDPNRIDPENVPLLHGGTPNILHNEEHEHQDVETDESTVESIDHRSKKIDTSSNDRENLEETSEDETLNIWSLLQLTIATPYSIAFFVAYFLLNVGFAVIENLVFLFYQAVLGSSFTMCGISVLFTIVLEIPVFYASPTLLHSLGPGNMLILACAAYVFRTIGYVLVPKMGLIVFALDLLHGITYACAQSASVAYIASIMPDSYEASGQGILMLIKGMGGAIGLVLGGVAQEYIGSRALYACLSSLVAFGMFGFVPASFTSTVRC